jgi:hypothetical protein
VFLIIYLGKYLENLGQMERGKLPNENEQERQQMGIGEKSDECKITQRNHASRHSSLRVNFGF